MALFDWFRGGRRAEPPSAVEPRFPIIRASQSGITVHDLNDPQIAEYLRGGALYNSASGINVTPAMAMRQAAFNRCVRLISDTVATMSFDVKERVSDQEVRTATDHPVAQLIKRKPNSWQKPMEFRRFLMDSVLTRGNAYAWKIQSRRRIIELWPLHPDRVRVEQNRDMSLTYQYRKADGGVLQLPQDEIMHVRGPTDNGYVGLSVVQYAAHTLGLSAAIHRHAGNTFKNGTHTGTVLTHPKTLDDDAQDRLRESIDAFAGDGEKAGKALILEENMKFDKLGMTSVDAQLLEIMEASDVQVAMFFGVPPVMLGIMTKSTSFGAGVGQMGQYFVDYALMPHIKLLDEVIDLDLIADRQFYAHHNPASLMRGDIEGRYKAYAIGRQWGWLSPNDVREMEDQNPVPNGGEYIRPLNMAPLGTAAPAQSTGSTSNGQESTGSGAENGGNTNV